MSKSVLMSTAEYLRTPETRAPAESHLRRAQGGRLADAATPGGSGRFLQGARCRVRESGLGRIWLSPIDVILDAKSALILQPDLLFISNERRHILTDRIRGAPDMVLEVLSPDPRIGKIDERVRWFAEYDVRECWVLHQAERRLEVVGCAGGVVARRNTFLERTLIQSEVLPEFNRTVGSILSWGE